MRRVAMLLEAMVTVGAGEAVSSRALAIHLDWNLSTTRYYLWILRQLGYASIRSGDRPGYGCCWQLIDVGKMPEVELPRVGADLHLWALKLSKDRKAKERKHNEERLRSI